MIKTFESFSNYDNDYEHTDKIIEYSTVWCDEFPELRKFKLNSDFKNKSWIWNFLYTEKDKEMIIKIVDNNSNWDIYYEYYNINDIINEENHFFKKNLTYEELLSNLSKISYYIRTNK